MFWNVPEVQPGQELAPEAALAVPAGQSRHVPELVEPLAVPYLPGAQLVQTVEPGDD